MTNAVVVDVESVPTEAALAAPYPSDERQPPGNYSKPEAIASWREKDEAKWNAEREKECSLNPRLGRVLCIGYSLLCSDGPVDSVLIAKTEADEAKILTEFWGIVASTHGRVVTFNGHNFDIRFLVLRSLHHGIEPSVGGGTVRDWFRRYTVQPHFDCRAILTNWDSWSAGTLGDWCDWFGIPHENGVSGADVYELYKAGEFGKIAAHAKDDAAATRALFTRLAPMFGGG